MRGSSGGEAERRRQIRAHEGELQRERERRRGDDGGKGPHADPDDGVHLTQKGEGHKGTARADYACVSGWSLKNNPARASSSGRAPVAHGEGSALRALRTVMGRVKAGRAGSTAAGGVGGVGGVGGGAASPAAAAAPAPGLAASAMVCWILATICETCWSLKPLPRCLARKDRATLSG